MDSLTLCKLHYDRVYMERQGRVGREERPDAEILIRPDLLRAWLRLFDRVIGYVWRTDDDWLKKFGRCRVLYCYETYYREGLCLRCYERENRLVV